MKFPHYNQTGSRDCGPTCLRIISKYYGREISLLKLCRLCETDRQGTSINHISETAEKIGFRTLGVKLSYEKLKQEVLLPCIVFWRQQHFVVVYKIKKNKVFVSDPAHSLLEYSKEEFIENWIGNGANEKSNEGICLLLEPTHNLKKAEPDDIEKERGFKFLYQYLFRYKRFLLQLICGLIAGSLIQLIFPFLTQSIVDVGIKNKNINFVYLILVAQLFLFVGRTTVELLRSWILLHLSTRINISLISDFFIKLMNLPIAFFDVKMTGDLIYRIYDHQRIERLLTNTSLSVLFSFFNLIIFGAVLAWYSFNIFLIFLTGSIIYFAWITVFLTRRKELDYKKFRIQSDEQSKVIELINGMQEIKLHNAEKQKRWSWEFLQARLFKREIQSLKLEQIQTSGSGFINELKNILITVVCAKLVIEGKITLGMMLSVSYIIGQLNSPIQQLIGFIYSMQDAKIALERLSEIHNKEDEEVHPETKIYEIDGDSDIKLNKISFHYTGATEKIIKDLSLTIPAKKITAIVGSSGSGKTTLMKLLLKFYLPDEGLIKIGNIDLNNISQKSWRDKCGVVMQEGYIFNDTIANNIAIGIDRIDRKRLIEAVEVANIREFIEKLPLAYNTKIGMEGVGMSTGQKQRLLIARAVYKNPGIIFFDEATSALDAKNEQTIIKNLNSFFKGKTVVIVAHRLSTVKNADQILVLDNGKIIEKGSHHDLVSLKGNYFNLVKNQLELDHLNNHHSITAIS
ncbi:MAG TPA: peptidase domain-containing ABC transporter [Bacteroidia bacterium]|nr:peptidase domain-containing ABC transporter [Bacteroidia bacterium]